MLTKDRSLYVVEAHDESSDLYSVFVLCDGEYNHTKLKRDDIELLPGKITPPTDGSSIFPGSVLNLSNETRNAML